RLRAGAITVEAEKFTPECAKRFRSFLYYGKEAIKFRSTLCGSQLSVVDVSRKENLRRIVRTLCASVDNTVQPKIKTKRETMKNEIQSNRKSKP
ncbi:hypothetical protein QYP05_29865, partial [Pseudomonas aeruginosa]|nr:hypothetical protein [Pseudomonas aeruginosa]